MDSRTLEDAIRRHIRFSLCQRIEECDGHELFVAVGLAVRDLLIDRGLGTFERFAAVDPKRIYYLSMEFLMGRSLENNLQNLGLLDACRQAVAAIGADLDQVLEAEPDAALGNGGLGRLAACFLDSMATMDLPAFGYGINYDFGLFRQEIIGGEQRERPDQWRALGTPWQVARDDLACVVPLYGRVETSTGVDGAYRPHWINERVIVGLPHDFPIVGYGGRTVNMLRLYSARASSDFDMEIFNSGDYVRAVERKAASETVSKVLYPSDAVATGKELRLVQEYLVEDGVPPRVPKSYVFAGKAAPGYWRAKQIIHLVAALADVINRDPRTEGRIRVVFVPDYRVSLAEVIIPACDLSEQISTAGTEASGTGNMKFAINGALTIGTLDGANIEILEAVGPENIFIFGLTVEEAFALKADGYDPAGRCAGDRRLRRLLEAFDGVRFSPSRPGVFGWVRRALIDEGDRYLHQADFASYAEAQRRAESEYTNHGLWARKAILNVARMGRFSSDRTVAEYARDIWDVRPV